MLVFKGIRNLQNHQVELHINEAVRPIVEPPILYHIQNCVPEVIEEIIGQNIIGEQPKNETALWTSNIVVTPKTDGNLGITLDAHYANKARQSLNLPIPKQEDINDNRQKCLILSLNAQY